jgi:glutathionylspermidine synthase
MEIFPEKQKTRIDFTATKQAIGIETVCMTKINKEGKQLFYTKNGQKTPIKRIYNRVIVDELKNIPDLKTQFQLTDDLDVEWITHPDWFFIISKCILPLLKHKYIPKSYYLNNFPEDLALSDYVLKPLFSFAGKGINLHPNAETIENIVDKQNYILQRKVKYAPLIETNTEKNSKVELRMLYIWDKEHGKLKPVVNLTRMSKGELINVSYLTEDTWIGSSISFFEE